LLVLDRDGGVYGATYRWRADLSDADLVGPMGLNETIAIRDPSGSHDQIWSYPSRENCVTCHNARTAGQLGPKTRQLNSDLRYPGGAAENQLRHWNRLGLFSPTLNEADIAAYTTLARAGDPGRSLEDRARSYLDANCSQCHRPGGTVANFDARYQTPLAMQNLIDGPVLIDQGIDRPRVISPHDPWRSLVIRRTDTNDDTRMPPIARHTIDAQGVALLRQWIASLPGRDVLAPPTMQPAGGDFKGSVTVSLASSDPGAQIRYTLDGSVPGPSDPIYDKPVHIDGPAVLRARTYKEGLTRSVVVQQTYVVDR
jgi:mono/diheme cytochrome c family protein